MSRPTTELPESATEPAGETTSLLQNGYLTVSVPEGAKIFVNDKPTTTTGTFRRYKTPSIDSETSLTYQVKAVVEKDGQQLTQTKVVDLTSGDSKHLEFEFETDTPPVTVLSLNVPEDAEVTLAGNPTSSTGPTRLFTTTNLRAGDQWKDYTIVVTANVEGRKVVKTKTIDLNAGDSIDLDFEFAENSTRLASR